MKSPNLQPFLDEMLAVDKAINSGANVPWSRIRRLLRSHLTFCDAMRVLLSPGDIKVDEQLRGVLTDAKKLGWTGRMLTTLLVLFFVHAGPRRSQCQAYRALRHCDSRWRSVNDADFLLEYLSNDLMHEVDIPVEVRFHCFERTVELSEMLSPLAPADISITGRPELMREFSQGEMWVRVGQRHRRLQGGACPVWHQGTFEYALLHDREFRRLLQLDNPMVREILKKWSWLRVFRANQRVAFWFAHWRDRRYQHQILSGLRFTRLRIIAETLVLWSAAISAAYLAFRGST